jgi:hypothetical protein
VHKLRGAPFWRNGVLRAGSISGLLGAEVLALCLRIILQNARAHVNFSKSL